MTSAHGILGKSLALPYYISKTQYLGELPLMPIWFTLCHKISKSDIFVFNLSTPDNFFHITLNIWETRLKWWKSSDSPETILPNHLKLSTLQLRQLRYTIMFSICCCCFYKTWKLRCVDVFFCSGVWADCLAGTAAELSAPSSSLGDPNNSVSPLCHPHGIFRWLGSDSHDDPFVQRSGKLL